MPVCKKLSAAAERVLIFYPLIVSVPSIQDYIETFNRTITACLFLVIDDQQGNFYWNN